MSAAPTATDKWRGDLSPPVSEIPRDIKPKHSPMEHGGLDDNI
jgi:hypothetical protein